jgi:hypothetical protein
VYDKKEFFFCRDCIAVKSEAPSEKVTEPAAVKEENLLQKRQ